MLYALSLLLLCLTFSKVICIRCSQSVYFTTNLVENINKEKPFRTILYQTDGISDDLDCLIQRLAKSLSIPVIIQTQEGNPFYLKEIYNHEILAITYLNTAYNLKLIITNLAYNLEYIRQTRILFVLSYISSEDKKLGQHLKHLFEICIQNRMIYVMAILKDFDSTRSFYTFNGFVLNAIDVKSFTENSTFYPFRVNDIGESSTHFVDEL